MTPFDTNSEVSNQNHNLKMNSSNKISDVLTGPSLYLQQSGATGQTYKLIIQVDKVRARPGPKSKKRKLMTITTSKFRQKNQCYKIQKRDLHDDAEKDDVPIDMKSHSENSTANQDDSMTMNNIQCSVRQKYLDSTSCSHMNKKEQCICQFCDTPFETKHLCHDHEKLHITSDTQFPYKCHLCPKTFDNKQNLKTHNKLFHLEAMSTIKEKPMSTNNPNILEKSDANKSKYQCEICKAVLKNHDTYRNHIVSHAKQNEITNENTNEKHSKLNNSENMKYSCKICSKEFDTPDQAETHAYSHVEKIESERKCNICKKLFNTEKMLNDHLAHHLSVAHHCEYCRKAFINRTTLNNHMKTHKNIKFV